MQTTASLLTLGIWSLMCELCSFLTPLPVCKARLRWGSLMSSLTPACPAILA